MDTICSPSTEWALKYISTATYLQKEKEKDYLTASSGTSWGGEVSCAQSQKGLEHHWNSLELSQCVMPGAGKLWPEDQIWPTDYFCKLHV